RGWKLSLPASDVPALHYCLAGNGTLATAHAPPIHLAPHRLVIAPPGQAFRIDAAIEPDAASTPVTVQQQWPSEGHRLVAGPGKPDLLLICGYFRASCGASIDLFSTLPSPIVEQFGPSDGLAQKLTASLAELRAPQVGTGAMTAALLK